MRYIFVSIAVLIMLGGSLFSGAQTLKGLTIGEKHNGTNEIVTTVGGYQGKITLYALKDSTIAGFHFISKEKVKDELEAMLLSKKADEFLQNIEANYKITFDRENWNGSNFYGGDIVFCSSNKEGVEYSLQHAYTRSDNFSNIVFTMINTKLMNEIRTERYLDKMNDF
ncbi:hypothetical protein SAMN05444285_102247 [Draconibacterium orientale]|uniref:Uncharacterized protein n=2 Tax=Draconibacterium orientale TaxID=1168034 RepID=A0A1H9ZRP5_9BACT|nr:hypothetical protein [Draconibacterium orientale]SES84397.1 hypothetical protein SAMN05444285_102247 [Draconibacterium orientale]